MRTAGCLSPSPSLVLAEAFHVGFFFFSSLAIHSALLSLCLYQVGKQMAKKEERGKTGKVERHVKWTAWLARQIMQVEFKYKNKDSSRRDRAAEQLFTCNAASSKRSSTDSFSKPNFVKLLVLPLQLCQALGQLRNSPLCMPPRTARRQGPAPVSCHGGHFLLQWLRGETTTASTDVDWHWGALVKASSCPLRQNVTPASGDTRFLKTISQSNVFELDNLPRQAQSFQLHTSTKTTEQNMNN